MEDENDEYKPHYSVRMSKTAKTARAESPKKIDNLVDLEHNLFELTLSRFAPAEPLSDPKHKPVRRVRIWDHHGAGKTNEDSLGENVNHVVGKLQDCEHFRTDRLNSNKEFHNELRASEARLRLVKRGVPLYKALQEPSLMTYNSARRPTKKTMQKSQSQVCPPYTPVEPDKRFDGVSDAMHKIPAKYTGIPPVRKVQFVYPVTSKQPERVDLVSKINLTDQARTRLKKARQRSENLQLQYHNEMIEHLNHVNERRLRQADKFFEDTAEQGLHQAEMNAKRSSQRSRLRTMSKVEWWEDFINFSFPNNNISKREEKFIERMARHPNLSPSEFIDLVREIGDDPKNNKCREMLDWINERCQIIDTVTLKLMLEDSDLKRIKRLNMND